MKIIFAGTPAIAATSLSYIHQNSHHEIVGVLTAPPRRVGRGRKQEQQPEVATLAEELGLDIYQPQKLDDDFLATMQTLGADLLVVVAYGVIFKQAFLDIFPLGAVNLHPSLLPQYRGPSPLNAALLDGLESTGITVQKMVFKMDAGPILSQTSLPIDSDDNIVSLTETAAIRGAKQLSDSLDDFTNLSAKMQEQDHAQATFCHLIKKQDGLIDWNNSADFIYRQHKAYYLWPSITSIYQGKMVKLLEVMPVDEQHDKPLGAIIRINADSIDVACRQSILRIFEWQLEGKKASNIKQYLNGHTPEIGVQLGV